MLRRRIVGGLRLHQRGLRRIQVAARNRALGKELLAALNDVLVQIEIGLGLRHIQLGLLSFFRHLRLGCRGVLRLRRHVRALVVQCRRGQIAIFERGQQLALPSPAIRAAHRTSAPAR